MGCWIQICSTNHTNTCIKEAGINQLTIT
uniref:Protein TOPLESS-like n=1 Tax=Rhizophora mucronata TaxID=61149 RepID=A0A2P2KHU4_RHIMU